MVSHKVRPTLASSEVPSYSSSPWDEDRETYHLPQGLGPTNNTIFLNQSHSISHSETKKSEKESRASPVGHFHTKF